MAEHTPTPWDHGGVTKDRYVTAGSESEGIFELGDVNIFPPLGEAGPVAIAAGAANAAFIVKAANNHETLVKALRNVQKLISEAAMTGFNYEDGDWADRLFESQQVTSAALRDATGLASDVGPSRGQD